MKKFILRIVNAESIAYVIVGCLTTLVNFIIFTVFNEGLKPSLGESIAYKIAYVVAFLVAVIFAYWTNKFYVFRNHDMRPANLFREFTAFMAARVFSGIVTFLMMIVLVDFLKANTYFAWFATTFFNLVFNYVASKFWIFQQDGSASCQDETSGGSRSGDENEQ